MFHLPVDRSMDPTAIALIGVMLVTACAGPARGQAPSADGKRPLNERVFRSCFGVNTHFWQGQPLEEIALVEDIGATWIRDEGNWSGQDADPATYDTSWLEKWVNEVTPSPRTDPGLMRESNRAMLPEKGFSDHEEATQC